MQRQTFKTLLLILAALVWGIAFVAQSVGAEYVGPFTFLAVRNWIAVAALAPVIPFLDAAGLGRRPSGPAERRTLGIAGIICGAALFAASATQQAGIAYTTTAKAGFITTMYVLFVPLFSMLFGKRLSRGLWLCVLLGVLGLYLLCMKGSFRLEYGDSIMLVCAMLFAVQILSVDRFVDRVDGVRLSQRQFLTTAVLSTAAMFLFEKPEIPMIMKAMPAILYAGLMSSGVGYTLQIVGQKDVNPTVASLALSLESVFSAIAGWAILSQSMSLREILGAGLMFLAIVLAQTAFGK